MLYFEILLLITNLVVMNSEKRNIDNLFRKREGVFFSSITENELDKLVEIAFMVDFNPGEIILKQGTATDHFITLSAGYAKIYVEGINYKKLIIDYLKVGEMLASPGTWVDKKHHFTIKAVVPCKVCYMNVDEVLSVLSNNLKALEAIHTEKDKRTNAYLDKMVCLTQKQMHGRVADALLYLHEKLFSNSEYTFAVDRQDLADITALSRDSATRIIKEFQNSGILNTNGDEIEIQNFSLLEQISEFG